MNIEITANRNHVAALTIAIDAMALHTVTLQGREREKHRLAIEDLDQLRDMVLFGLDIIEHPNAPIIL